MYLMPTTNKINHNTSAVARANHAWTRIGRLIKNRDGSYAKANICMTRKQFRTWAIPLYEQWEIDHPGDRPSLVRKDDRASFRISNLELVPYSEGHSRSHQYFQAKPDGTKICTDCKLAKSVLVFHKDTYSSPDGLYRRCKACVAIHSKQRYHLKGQLRKKKVEDTAGVEPATSGVRSPISTTELRVRGSGGV